jgi:hypothetical protein
MDIGGGGCCALVGKRDLGQSKGRLVLYVLLGVMMTLG